MQKESKSTMKAVRSRNKDLQKKLKLRLDQQELSSISFGSDSTDSADSYLKCFRASIDEEVNIFDRLQQSDTESLEEDEQEIEVITFEPESDLLELFGKVPNFDEVSEDISITSQPKDVPIIYNEESVLKIDRGKFVNPLTGLVLYNDVELRTSESEDQQFASEEKEEEVFFKDSEPSDSSELLLASDISEEEKKSKDDSVDETLAAFFELKDQSLSETKEEIDWEALLKAAEAKAAREYTLTFLNELVDKVVQYSEHLSPEKFLQKNLDKRKLITELSHLVPELQVVKNVCSFLNRQIVRHFRRKKSFRCLMPDNTNTVLQEKRKLKQAKERLDQVLAKEKYLKRASAELQAELSQQYKNLKQETESHIEIFQNQVLRHFCRDGSSRTKAVIDRSLLIMSKFRQEISEVRLSLLLHQHTGATLQTQINKMNDLGNGLTVPDFTTFEAENKTLDKKIEERSTDLNKIHRRWQSNVNSVAHYKETQQMIYNRIREQRTMLDALTKNQRLLRERLVSLKLQRNRIYEKMKKLRSQGGLLDKPDLMKDYDETVKIIGEKQEKVEYLRRTLLTTQSKIDRLIAHCQNLYMY